MFTTFEELKKAAAERRQDTLTLELDMSGEYCQEYEDAKTDLQASKLLSAATGVEFMGDTTPEQIAGMRPNSQPVWLKFKRLPVAKWSLLVKSAQQMDALAQYENILPEIFLGIWGDPDADQPLTTEPKHVGTSKDSVLSGSQLVQVVQAVLKWQNSGGDVVVNPTR